jgi:cell division septation protein DedD
VPGNNKANSGSAAAPMTFYKSVEQKDANADLTPPADAKTETSLGNTTPAQAAPTNGADSSTTLPTGGYFVQVAAVSKQEDANSLVDALKQKQYPAFVASSVANDKLFRVQLGPFSEVKEAEGMRARLIADGYSPILKK